MTSSQKSQFRSTGRHDGIHEEDLVPGRREPFRAVPINRKNLPSSFDSISRRNEKLDQVSKRNREELDLLEESDVDEENHITSKKNCYTRHNVDLDQQTSRPNRGTPRMLVRASESSQSVSSNKSSVLGISDDSSTLVTEHLQKRIEDLENDVVMLKVQMRKLITQGSALAGGKNTSFDLSPFQASVIGRIVREDMFKAVKFLDQKTIQVQGQKLFLKCLQAGKFDEEQSDNKCLFDTIMKRARKSLNIFKSHVKSDIRKAARCK